MALVEKVGSRQVSYTSEGITGQCVFQCDWGERYAVAPPIGTPFPDLIGLYASNVKLAPFGRSVPSGGYEHCKITVDYSTSRNSREGAQDDGAIVDESLEFAGEMLTKGAGRFENNPDAAFFAFHGGGESRNAPKEVVGGKWYPRLEYTIEKVVDDINKWVRIIRKKTGKVNSTGWKGGAKEHWLFEGASTQNFVDSAGQMKWRLMFRFCYREEISWQMAWDETHTDGPRWNTVWFPDAGGSYTKKLYETTAFGPLEL